MSDCTMCHQPLLHRDAPANLIQADLHFSHLNHRSDRKGTLISCSTCHPKSANAPMASENHAAPSMGECVACHDDQERVPNTMRMRRCETCHSTRITGLGSIAPRSHLPATERPRGHTRAFRRDHTDDALANPQGCASCHTSLSGNRRNTCDECHQTMRPSDHVVTWREYDHGPEAATDAQRCTTCHQADFCTTCHRGRPRSHFPQIEFRGGGHGTQALLNLRACVTCHRPERDCSSAGCHQGTTL